MCHFNSPGCVQSCGRFAALNLLYTLPSCPTRYSFSPESSEAFEGKVSCPRTHHFNNVSRLRGEKHDISLKILHQAGFVTARQAATSAERHNLTIAPCPSLISVWCHNLVTSLFFNNSTFQILRLGLSDGRLSAILLSDCQPQRHPCAIVYSV